MTSVSAVRTALAAQVTAQTGLPCSERMPSQVNPTQAVILPGNPYAKYGLTLGEHIAVATPKLVPVVTGMSLSLAVFASLASSLERAQQTVDQYLGFEPSDTVVSVPVALNYDPSLGGIVEWCLPVAVTAYGDIEIAGQTYFQGRISLDISVHTDLS